MDGPRRVLGAIIAFHPDPRSVPGAVAAARLEVDRLVVVENAATAESRSVIDSAVAPAPGTPSVHLAPVERIENPSNAGVSVAFNQAIDRALAEGFEFVLLLDQDSILRPGSVERLVQEHRSLSPRFRVGALQARNVEPGGRVPLDARRREHHARRGRYAGPTSFQGLLLLNSGALIPTEAFRTVGRFDERYFVDLVDYEFSLRLARAGFAIFHVPEAVIEHNVGSAGPPSPVRLYYAIRELTRLIRTYGRRYPDGVAPVAWTTLNRLGSVVLRSGRPAQSATLAVRAVFDGLLGVSGEFTPSPVRAR